MESNIEENTTGAVDNEVVNLQGKSKAISGFWRRIAAFLIDSVLIGIIGAIIGFSGFSFFSQLGISGRLFGFGICLLYFGLGNSRLMNGQTLGKRILKIQVIDNAGQLISLGKSATRYTVLGAPFFLNNAPLPPTLAFSHVAIIITSLIIFGIGGSIIYLYIFNRNTRQSLHDLVAGTFVVNVDRPTEIDAKMIWKGHYALITSWMILVLVFVIVTNFIASRWKFLSELEPLYRQLYTSTNAKQVSVFVGKNWFNEEMSTYLRITISWRGELEDYESEVNNIADMIFKLYPKAKDKDIIVIRIVRGFDIGISSGSFSRYFSYPPKEWQKRISGSG